MGDTPWKRSFVIDDDPNGGIRIRQTGSYVFALESTVRYVGKETGLEGKLRDDVLVDIREVGPGSLPQTDLTSVPFALLWLVGRYGSHTPAALIHDRLIANDPPINGLTGVLADRYFRTMLKDLEVPLFRRWLMWAAVTIRSRASGRGLHFGGVLIWLVAMAVGMAVAAIAFLNQNWILFGAAAMAPLAAAGLWGRQYGAGLIGAYVAPLIALPLILGLIAGLAVHFIERLLEWVVRTLGVGGSRHPT